MLRCAARISSGSACAIAFSAASRSPRLIASSTERTAPRISVRRDLLITVRRAILRVAFLAEVVLAIVSDSLRCRLRLDRGWARRLLEGVVDAAGVSERSCACRLPEPKYARSRGYAQRTAAAGLPPPPSAPL